MAGEREKKKKLRRERMKINSSGRKCISFSSF